MHRIGCAFGRRPGENIPRVVVDELREATSGCEAVVRSFTLGVPDVRAYRFYDDCVAGRSLAQLVNDYKNCGVGDAGSDAGLFAWIYRAISPSCQLASRCIFTLIHSQ